MKIDDCNYKFLLNNTACTIVSKISIGGQCKLDKCQTIYWTLITNIKSLWNNKIIVVKRINTKATN